MPCIQYNIQSSNFIFIKTLDLTEFRDYGNFQDWHTIALKQLMGLSKFQALILDMPPSRFGESGMEVEPANVENRMYRITTKKAAKSQMKAQKAHSKIPGQCKHENCQLQTLVTQSTVMEDSSIASTPKSQQPCVFEMKNKNDTQVIKKYNSLIDYERFNIRHENTNKLKGCFEKDNIIGQIHLSSFAIRIKSLVTEFTYFENVKIDAWEDFCGYMKK